MNDASDFLGEVFRNLVPRDTPQCKDPKFKINSWQGEFLSVGKMALAATSGWTDEHAAQPTSTESTPSTWSVTFVQTSINHESTGRNNRKPDPEKTSQTMTHTSSIPPAANTAANPTKQDTTMIMPLIGTSVTKLNQVPSTTSRDMETGLLYSSYDAAEYGTGADAYYGDTTNPTKSTCTPAIRSSPLVHTLSGNWGSLTTSTPASDVKNSRLAAGTGIVGDTIATFSISYVSVPSGFVTLTTPMKLTESLTINLTLSQEHTDTLTLT